MKKIIATEWYYSFRANAYLLIPRNKQAGGQEQQTYSFRKTPAGATGAGALGKHFPLLRDL